MLKIELLGFGSGLFVICERKRNRGQFQQKPEQNVGAILLSTDGRGKTRL